MPRDRSGYLPALDGVRGVLILVVLYVHCALIIGFRGRYIFIGGAITVDSFFVMSGYLITTLLLREHRLTGKVSLKQFYARRVLRLFPALAITLVGAGLIVAYVGSNWSGIAYGKTAIATLFYVGNWVAAARPLGLGVLSPTWSLAIEEQFYLLWPPLLVWLLARGVRPRRVAMGLLVPVIAMAVVRAFVYRQFGLSWAYFSTFAKGDGLLLGCFLALVLETAPDMRIWETLRRPLVGTLATLSLVALAIAVTVTGLGVLFYGGYTLVYVLYFLLVANLVLTSGEPTRIGRFLSRRPVVWNGRISYGLYLYHFPLFVFAAATQLKDWPYAPRFAATISLPFIAAILSYALVERRALMLKNRFKPGVAGRVRDTTPRLPEPAADVR